MVELLQVLQVLQESLLWLRLGAFCVGDTVVLGVLAVARKLYRYAKTLARLSVGITGCVAPHWAN